MIFLTKKNRKPSFFNQFAESWQLFTKMGDLTLKSRIAPYVPLWRPSFKNMNFMKFQCFFTKTYANPARMLQLPWNRFEIILLTREMNFKKISSIFFWFFVSKKYFYKHLQGADNTCDNILIKLLILNQKHWKCGS